MAQLVQHQDQPRAPCKKGCLLRTPVMESGGKKQEEPHGLLPASLVYVLNFQASGRYLKARVRTEMQGCLLTSTLHGSCTPYTHMNTYTHACTHANTKF